MEAEEGDASLEVRAAGGWEPELGSWEPNLDSLKE